MSTTHLKFYQTGSFAIGNRLVDPELRSVQSDEERFNALTSGHRACQGCGEALGARYRGAPVGAQGQDAVFAFYPNKQITTGEGGLVVTDDAAAANLMRALRNQGRAPGDTWLQHTFLGYNYRLTNLQAALGCAQIEQLDMFLARKIEEDFRVLQDRRLDEAVTGFGQRSR